MRSKSTLLPCFDIANWYEDVRFQILCKAVLFSGNVQLEFRNTSDVYRSLKFEGQRKFMHDLTRFCGPYIYYTTFSCYMKGSFYSRNAVHCFIWCGFFHRLRKSYQPGKNGKNLMQQKKRKHPRKYWRKEIKVNQQYRGIFRSEVRHYRCLKIRATRPMALCQTQEVSAIRDRQHSGLKEHI